MTYANKVEKHEAQIDWSQDANKIVRRIRAFDPFPGATSTLQGETVKIWAAESRPGAPSAPPGSVLAIGPEGISVAARDGVVVVTALQRAGGKRLAAADFLRGFDLRPGQDFA
jgi:methionyl-tRNA formyltransferase